MKSFKKWGAYCALFCFFVMTGIIGSVRTTYADKMHTPHPDPEAQIMILGGKVESDGSASVFLENRVRSGALLAQEQEKAVWLSGDSGWKRKNEMAAMAEILEDFEGVDYIVDGKVGRTVDSCWRAKHVHNLSSLILITQKFHMPRALYLCNEMGIDTYGVVAKNARSGVFRALVRDYLASMLAWKDIQFDYQPVHTDL